MRSRYDAYLNDIALSSLHTDIQVLDISYASPSVKNTTFSLANRSGLRLARRYVDSTSVTISFEIHIPDPRKRQDVCQDIARWANKGGILRTTDRASQMLRCVCTNYPTINSAMRWTDTMSVAFTAFPFPFWQTLTPKTLTLTGTSADGQLFVEGSAPQAFAEAQITANAALTTLTLTAGDTAITLSGISIPQGGIVKLYYDEDYILHIKYGDTSLLNKRTGSDDLLVNCNDFNTLAVTANASVTCVYTVRGAWL